MQNLLNFTYEELESFIISIGEAKFRAKQIFSPMHKGISPADLTNLSAKTLLWNLLLTKLQKLLKNLKTNN